MKYFKCNCKTTVDIYTLKDELQDLNKKEFTEKLAEIIGGWCMFRNDSHIGRGFNKIESATRGNQVFKWNRDGDDWTFTATVIGLDYEDEINCEYLPFFEITDEDYKAISEAISEPETEEKALFEEIENVTEIHTYKLHDDWFLEVRLEQLPVATWCGYIYRKGYSPMFVYGECLDQCTLYSNWTPYKVTLEEFLDSMHYALYEEEIGETPFEEFDRQIELIEESNMRILNEMEQ